MRNYKLQFVVILTKTAAADCIIYYKFILGWSQQGIKR